MNKVLLSALSVMLLTACGASSNKNDSNAVSPEKVSINASGLTPTVSQADVKLLRSLSLDTVSIKFGMPESISQ